MHPEDIKASIRKRNTSQSGIAASLGITVMTVSHVINGRGKSARVAKRISEVIGLPVDEIWPGKYSTNVKPGPKVRKPPPPA